MGQNNLSTFYRGISSNMGTTERTLSVLAGAFLMCNSLSKRRSLPKALIASYLLFRGTTGVCPAYKALGRDFHKSQNINIKTSLSINRPVNEVYGFWRRLENLPLSMSHLKSVKVIDSKTSEWEAKIPGGMGTLKWKSEIVKDIPNEHLGWQSLPGSMIENAGNLKFLDAGKYGTEVQLVISYRAPGGIAGEGIGRLLNATFERTVREDLKSLKHFLEVTDMAALKGTGSAEV